MITLKKCVKVLSVTFLAIVLVFSSFIFSNVSYAKPVDSPLTKEQLNTKIDILNNKLLDYLKNYDLSSDYDQLLTNFFNQGNTISPEELKIINDSDLIDTELKKSMNYSEDEIANSKILKSEIINGKEITFYNNGVFSIEDDEPEKANRVTASGTVTGTATKSYYSWVGLKLFTISVTCKFKYNGSKASYHSGLDGYYKRGILSIWQVSNWQVGREQAGTSYTAYAKGNFHYGFEIKGIGIIVQELYIKHVVTCSKTGKITKSYYIY